MSRIIMRSADCVTSLNTSRWDAAIIGDQVDDRGNATTEFAINNSLHNFVAKYNPNMVGLTVDGTYYSPDQLAKLLLDIDGENILLEATTLGFVEVFLFCKAAREAGIPALSLLYAEPASYKVPNRGQVLHKRDFELSDEVEDFSGIPGAALMLRVDRSDRVVFLLGYEGQRLEQALEQTNVRPSESAVIFGVPAFQTGWEMDSFANNVRIIKERQIREILYAGAQNPAGAYSALKRVLTSCTPNQRLLISPIGTKPHGIGAAVFACDFPNVGLLYDHPQRSRGRSKNIAVWHLFRIEFDN